MKHAVQCLVIAALAVVVSVASVKAQSPSGQIGVGVSYGGGGSFAGVDFTSGSAAYLAYAINPAFHIGAQFRFQSANIEDVSSTGLLFGVYGKFLFAGPREFKPFLMAQFGVGSTSVEDASTSSQVLGVGFGGEYFATSNVGIYGGIGLLTLQFGDIDGTIVGIGGPFGGIEWFF